MTDHDDDAVPHPPAADGRNGPALRTTGRRTVGDGSGDHERTDAALRPPFEFVDREGRSIRVRGHDGAVEPLISTYGAFGPEDCAQGIPPLEEGRLREWLDGLLAAGPDVVALHDDRIVGHATLVPMAGDRYELAIFVAPGYRLAGIGSRLIRALLVVGRASRVGSVWLTVRRSNHVALALYRSVGFETTETGSEFEMERSL